MAFEFASTITQYICILGITYMFYRTYVFKVSYQEVYIAAEYVGNQKILLVCSVYI